MSPVAPCLFQNQQLRYLCVSFPKNIMSLPDPHRWMARVKIWVHGSQLGPSHYISYLHPWVEPGARVLQDTWKNWGMPYSQLASVWRALLYDLELIMRWYFSSSAAKHILGVFPIKWKRSICEYCGVMLQCVEDCVFPLLPFPHPHLLVKHFEGSGFTHLPSPLSLNPINPPYCKGRSVHFQVQSCTGHIPPLLPKPPF